MELQREDVSLTTVLVASRETMSNIFGGFRYGYEQKSGLLHGRHVGANSKERFKKLSSNRKRAINTELKRLLGK